jgi:hypothetical protein
MGTFEKSYEVDGVVVELFRQEDGGFQLLGDGALVAELAEIPSQDEVTTLVRKAA